MFYLRVVKPATHGYVEGEGGERCHSTPASKQGNAIIHNMVISSPRHAIGLIHPIISKSNRSNILFGNFCLK